MNTQRRTQVASALKRAIGQVLARGLSDPRVSGLISVTRVVVGQDFRDARVYVSVLPPRHEKRVVHGLQHAAGYVQSELQGIISMRHVPRLLFMLDVSLKKEADVYASIDASMLREGPALTDPVPEDTEPDAAVDDKKKDPASP